MKKLIAVVGVMFISTFAFAVPWQMVGPRAMGMGGAGVAVATGAEAQYWNPAGLAVKDEMAQNLMLGVGVQMETTQDVIKSIDGLNDLSNQYKSLKNKINTGGSPTAQDLTTIFEGLGDISKLTKQGTGVVVGADGGIGTKFKNFAVSVRSLGTAGVTPVVDAKNLGVASSFGGSGLSFSADTSAFSAGSARAQAADILAHIITATGTLASLNTLMGQSYATPADMANALVHTAIGAGSTDAQILTLAQAAAENLPSAAPLITTAASDPTAGSYKDNQSRAMADAGAFTEAALGYGHEILNGLQVGGNFKVIEGTLAQTGVLVLSDDKKIRDIISDAWDNKKNSTNIGIDLGARLNFAELLDKDVWGKPTIGITARNINAPKFKRPGLPQNVPAAIAQSWNYGDYKLKPQVRAGAALEMFQFLTLAADMDLTENQTNVAGYNSRQMAFGAEIDLTKGKRWGLPVRVGLNKNVAEADSEMYYTAGIGLRVARFWLELAGAMSRHTVDVDGNKIPASAAGSFQFGFVF